MSRKPINRSPDLCRLRDEGFRLTLFGAFLLVHEIPYVTRDRKVARGTLVTALELSGDVARKPNDHTMHFIGEFPCDVDGNPMEAISASRQDQTLAPGLVVNQYFSSKPKKGYYDDFYEKVSTYAAILASPAQAIEPNVTPRVHEVIESEPDDENAVFHYLDTNSARATIAHIGARLSREKVGIIGVGGTGAYVLDFVSKTPVAEIRIFDDDIFANHNAFRAPGAASTEQLREQALKVDYFNEVYSKLHRRITVHPYALGPKNLDLLDGLTFVFVCIDKGAPKQVLFERLESLGASFVDCGIGVEVCDASLLGIVRVTTSTAQNRRVAGRSGNRVSMADRDDDEYSQNIQISELNALCATMAVIKWKKIRGFYQDLEREHNSMYSINVNQLTSDEDSG